MNFFDAIKICFVKYTDFSGRASRSEFWLFTLFLFIVSIVLLFLDPMLAGEAFLEYDDIFAPLGTIFSIITFIPAISVTARRLHDVNRSGWWMLIFFTVIGIVPLLYWNCKKGDLEENRFGVNPFVKDPSLPS